MTSRHSLSIRLIWIMSRYSFGRNKPKEQKEKNVIIGELRPKNINDKVRVREVMMEKTPDGEESLKITIKASRPRGQESSSQKSSQPATQARPVRPVRQKAGPELSNLSARKEVLRRLMSQRCRGVLQSRSSPLLSY